MFKICSTCSKVWPQYDDFLTDTSLHFCGYQGFSDGVEGGLFLFNHNEVHCNSTISIPVSEFQKKILIEIPKVRIEPFGKSCPSLCKNVSNSEPCSNSKCKLNYIRQLIQIIKQIFILHHSR